MKVWISKYALTQGVYEVEVETCFNIAPEMVVVKGEVWKYGAQAFHRKGGDWHETRDSALREASRMKAAKIASLRKQIARLERLCFWEAEVARQQPPDVHDKPKLA